MKLYKCYNENKKCKMLLIALSCLNLLYMHYYIFFTCNIEDEYDAISFIDNFCACVIDISITFAFFYTITKKNFRISLLLCYSTTLIWSFCNILYSRFFFRYISLSAIGQSSNLFEWFMVECMADEIQIEDAIFIVSSIVFWFVYRKTLFANDGWKPILNTAVVLLATIFINITAHATYCLLDSKFRYVSYFTYRIYVTHIDTSRNTGRPNWANYHRGSFRMLISDLAVGMQGTMKLTHEQEAIIQKEINSSLHTSEKHKPNGRIKNIIFILVESYTAFTTDMKIDGKEVTPFLNRLRQEPDVYYNGKMKSNITIGQSSDGQFIYMTGLLPFRSIITVSKAKDRTLMALPKFMKLFNKDIETRMIIPTLPSLWEQDAMCNAYGFHHLYSSNDFTDNVERNLNDEQVFQLAAEIDMKSSKPFFSYILTMSMHGPYNKQIDQSFIINSKKYCAELTNFLNVCHYTDKQIEKYITHLKINNLYENSLIIIAPDHQVPENTMNVEQYGLTRELPLFIINGNIDQQKAWSGECNQLDVFPTILDLLGINSSWRGLGNSILSTTYQNSLTDQKWAISEWMLQSDYFKKQIK